MASTITGLACSGSTAEVMTRSHSISRHKTANISPTLQRELKPMITNRDHVVSLPVSVQSSSSHGAAAAGGQCPPVTRVGVTGKLESESLESSSRSLALLLDLPHL
jgi:hypothetical protein